MYYAAKSAREQKKSKRDRKKPAAHSFLPHSRCIITFTATFAALLRPTKNRVKADDAHVLSNKTNGKGRKREATACAHRGH